MPGPLAQKMKLRPGLSAAIINAPHGYIESLAVEDIILDAALNDQYDWAQIFVQNQAELEAIIASVKTALKPTGLLWVSFPKGSSKIQTDLTRDKGWGSVRDFKWINLISVNEIWSAFSLRPYKEGETPQSFR